MLELITWGKMTPGHFMFCDLFLNQIQSIGAQKNSMEMCVYPLLGCYCRSKSQKEHIIE